MSLASRPRSCSRGSMTRRSAICDLRWWLVEPRTGPTRVRGRPHPGRRLRGRRPRPRGAARVPGRHPLPDPGDVRRGGCASWASATGPRWSRTTTAAGSSPPACGGCSTTWATRRSRVLDGGFSAWVAIGGPVTDEVVQPAPAGDLTLAAGWSRVIDRDALARRLARGRRRAPRRPRPGALPRRHRARRPRRRPHPGRRVAGRRRQPRPRRPVPGPPGRSARRFEGLPGDARRPQCGSGINACHTALAMRVAGLPDPLLYPGSYRTGRARGMPVATGDEPGRYEG